MRSFSKSSPPPLVSIILPVYNVDRYLASSLDSLINQSYSHLEIIAINDGSTDSSLSILNSYANADKRIHVLSNKENLKISHTLNLGISKAKGKFIARMDADDIALPNRIKKQVQYHLSHPDTVIVGGQCQTIDTNSSITGHKRFPITHEAIKDGLFTGNPIQHPSAMINRLLLPKNFNWYDPTLPPAEDLDLFFRLGKYGKYANLKSCVLKYRQYLGSETFKNPLLTFSLTQKVRQIAVKKYSYKPSLKARIINFMQIILVSILPESLIYPVYLTLRGSSSPAKIVGSIFHQVKHSFKLSFFPE